MAMGPACLFKERSEGLVTGVRPPGPVEAGRYHGAAPQQAHRQGEGPVSTAAYGGAGVHQAAARQRHQMLPQQRCNPPHVLLQSSVTRSTTAVR